MTTQEFRKKSSLQIFLSYFRPHWKLFAMDLVCALMISLIDLAFPAVSRWCMHQLLPERAYGTFFAVMAVVFTGIPLASWWRRISAETCSAICRSCPLTTMTATAPDSS